MEVFETPEGFEVVDTDAFLGKEDAVKCHMLLYSDQHTWWMDKIAAASTGSPGGEARTSTTKSNSSKFNFDIKWTGDHVEKLGRNIAGYTTRTARRTSSRTSSSESASGQEPARLCTR